MAFNECRKLKFLCVILSISRVINQFAQTHLFYKWDISLYLIWMATGRHYYYSSEYVCLCIKQRRVQKLGEGG